MDNAPNPLDAVSVASPCRQSWQAMNGTDTVRFCTHCSKNVYNLSDMSRTEAEQLVKSTEGRVCVRFYRRADGTVVTADCSRIGKMAKMSVAMVALAIPFLFATITMIVGIVYVLGGQSHRNGRRASSPLLRIPVVKQIHDWIYPPPPPVVMGKMAPLPAPPAPTPPVGK